MNPSLNVHFTAAPGIWELLTHLWQSTAVALAILALIWFGRGLSARTRRTLGWMAVAKFALPAAWLVKLIERASGAPTPWLAPEAWQVPISFVAPQPIAALPSASLPLTQILAFLWAGGAVGLLVWWTTRAMRTRQRLLANTDSPSAMLREHVAAAAARVGLRAAPRCAIVASHYSPGAVGILSSVLILPRGLAEALAPSELQAILLHECVHLRRRDNLWAAVRALFVARLWFNPIAWLLSRAIHFETEKACDERVLELTGDADAYAQGIVLAVRHTLGMTPSGFTAATTPPVLGRLQAILGFSAKRDRPLLRRGALLAALGLVGLSGHAGSIAADAVKTSPSPAPAAVRTASAAVAKPEATLSVDFPDEDVRNILRNVADLFQLNVVMPESLQGKATIKLRDVTWRQIFTAVLEPKGHTFIERDGQITVVKSAPKTTDYRIGTLSLKFVGAAPGISEQAIRAAMQLRDGGTFDERKLDEDVRALYRLGHFKTVLVKQAPRPDGTIDLVFALTSNSTAATAAIEKGTLTFQPGSAPLPASAMPSITSNVGTLVLSNTPDATTGVTFEVPPAPAPAPATHSLAAPATDVQQVLRDAQRELATANAELQRLRDERATAVAKEQEAVAREAANAPAPAAKPPTPAAAPPTASARPPELRPSYTPLAASGPDLPLSGPSPTYRGMRLFETRELDRPPVARFQARPQYPYALRKAGIEGEAIIDFIVDTEGLVQQAQALQATHDDFAKAAVQAVSKWKFQPGKKGGRDVPTHMQMPIVFSIQ